MQIQTVRQKTLPSFKLPPELLASAPPEARGLRRDQVRLLVYERATDEMIHSRFDKLTEFLQSGDVLVLNDSRTIPASLSGYVKSRRVKVSLIHGDGTLWLASIAPRDAVECGMLIHFGEALSARLEDFDSVSGLGNLRFNAGGSEILGAMYRSGRPIQYEHLEEDWALDYFQTIYAAHPGSVEMPSAGRGFSWELIFRMKQKGIRLAYMTLHCGLSYLPGNQGLLPMPEWYVVDKETAEQVNTARGEGGRVIAVGTTVVRGLESAFGTDGLIHERRGWTDLRIDADHPPRAIDGLLTGFHEPESSHLDMISAFLGSSRLARMYREAIRQRYLWHEFGDTNLIL